MRKLMTTLLFLLIAGAAFCEGIDMKLEINGKSFSFKAEDNIASRALAKRLEKGPVTIEMRDYGGFEKVGSLGFSIPSADRSMKTVPGDIVLYSSDSIVIFYGSNSWAYTKIGHIDDTVALTDALQGRTVSVTFTAD